jgi:hypothetical protein
LTLTRTALWVAVLALAADALHKFPAEPDLRAHAVCEPVQWLMSVASAVSSSMDDRGRLGSMREPWRQDVHRSCLRVAERVFRTAA